MKKLLLFALSLGFSGTMVAQEEAVQNTLPERFQQPAFAHKSAMNVNDTILPSITCPSGQGAITFYSIGGQIITGTYVRSNGDTIKKVGQALNTANADVEVHSILALTVYKEEGANKGSFSAYIHDTTGGISASPVATSTPVGFDNVNDTNSASIITRFPFSTPVNMTTVFWAALDVDNGSDTLGVASTGSGCGNNAIFMSNAGWASYSSAFNLGGSPLTMSVHLWAEVENNSIGLDRNLISRSGLDFYPNPATDRAFIEADMEGENKVEVRIQDMTGQTMSVTNHQLDADSRIELDLSSLPQGAYTYQVVGSKKQLNGVFVKE